MASDAGAISLLKSEACTPSQLASKLPAKSPCYTFYSYPTPAPPPSAATTENKVASAPRNTFQASQGGARPVIASSTPAGEAQVEVADKEDKEEAEGKEGDDKQAGEAEETGADVKDLSLADSTPTPASPAPKGKGRVLFIYTCPSGSPIKFRMVYSSGVRGMQQDAKDKAGIDVSGKVSRKVCIYTDYPARDV